MYKINLNEFDEAYKILEDSFPKAELRPYDLMKKLFINNEIVFFGIKIEGELVVVLLSWEFDNFTFLENFAVKETHRNNGLGSICLSKTQEYYNVPIILEAEEPYDTLSERRIEFYKRNRFNITPYGYMQPPLNESINEIPLRILSYPYEINETTFNDFKEKIFHRVYKRRPE